MSTPVPLNKIEYVHFLRQLGPFLGQFPPPKYKQKIPRDSCRSTYQSRRASTSCYVNCSYQTRQVARGGGKARPRRSTGASLILNHVVDIRVGRTLSLQRMQPAFSEGRMCVVHGCRESGALRHRNDVYVIASFEKYVQRDRMKRSSAVYVLKQFNRKHRWNQEYDKFKHGSYHAYLQASMW